MQHTKPIRNPNPATASPIPSAIDRTSRNHARSQGAATELHTDEVLVIDGRNFLRIENIDRMPPFLMSVVSDTDFWLFVGSNGGFTGGRIDPDHAIFPYQTADKILGQPNACGVLSLVFVDGQLWEPWTAVSPAAGIRRNLYKHVTGTSVLFEEIHEPFGLVFQWELSVSQRFGLIRRCAIRNTGGRQRTLRLLDGWHHMLPFGISQETYSRYSYLASAYMRHESLPDLDLGLYTLNSGITDRAEPCESLRVSCAWTSGLGDGALLLSDRQVDAFRRGAAVHTETEVRGVFGAHLRHAEIDLEPEAAHHWHTIADTGLDHCDLIRLIDELRHTDDLAATLKAGQADGVLALRKRIAGAGAIQQTASSRAGIHHFANVLFNCMRGGTLDDNYRFPRADFSAFLETRNRRLRRSCDAWLSTLPGSCTLAGLREAASSHGDPQLVRLAGEYLPLCFSRRHGDPSRPWNRFEIRTQNPDGTPLFTYAGNWRDIFQNWESLAYSYPACFESMIHIFLNASTADGYNPYRITRGGIDWEIFDPEDPWSQIGYWGDHQIIYLLRLLEGMERFYPGRLASCLNQQLHSHANIPYEIKDFGDLLKDPKHSITFNDALHRSIMNLAPSVGSDAKLLCDGNGEVVLVSLAEKLLVPLLAKLSNLVPGGGIWLNTQRPEWNDANNALAGWGLSVVTVCHMRRYVRFLQTVFRESPADSLIVTEPVARFMRGLMPALESAGEFPMTDASRFEVLQALGMAGEAHRHAVYKRGPAPRTMIEPGKVGRLLELALAAIDATLRVNRRDDRMFHSYNVLEVAGGEARVRHLDLMLEGQVAALGSGLPDSTEALALLKGMRGSALFREDQHSYLLYPDRNIQPFLQRNTLPKDWETFAPRLAPMMTGKDWDLVRIDDHGNAHFHPGLASSRDLLERLHELATDATSQAALAAEKEGVLRLWEAVFHHLSFTGRSGAMFAFEGLGSIYWHMVAKLLLATQEVHHQAWRDKPDSRETRNLAAAYYDIRNGLGFTKHARNYGAFPTDPYSHSPRHTGAQQPGMTGQVKEEVLTRMGELGVEVEGGRLAFRPVLLSLDEFFPTSHTFRYIDMNGESRDWKLAPGTLAFTVFQVPVCYELAKHGEITLGMLNGETLRFDGTVLPSDESRRLFQRDHGIRTITVRIRSTSLAPEVSQ